MTPDALLAACRAAFRAGHHSRCIDLAGRLAATPGADALRIPMSSRPGDLRTMPALEHAARLADLSRAMLAKEAAGREAAAAVGKEIDP